MASGVDKRGRVSSSRTPKRSDASKSRRYRVAKGTQVNHDGKVYAEGEKLTAPVEEAFAWVARGYVEEVK